MPNPEIGSMISSSPVASGGPLARRSFFTIRCEKSAAAGAAATIGASKHNERERQNHHEHQLATDGGKEFVHFGQHRTRKPFFNPQI